MELTLTIWGIQGEKHFDFVAQIYHKGGSSIMEEVIYHNDHRKHNYFHAEETSLGIFCP